MTNLSFWAQSLDNESPDFIYRNGEKLSNDELRQQFVSEIYEFPAKKLESFPSDSSISIRYSDPKFVIEAIPSQKDQANRLAPVLIYGEFPDNPSSEWVDNVCDEIEKFIQDKLGRTLDSNTLRAINNWLNKILDEKKKKSKAFNWIVSLILVILVTLVVIGLIQSQGWKLSNMQVAGLITFSNMVVISLQTFLTSKLYRRLKTR